MTLPFAFVKRPLWLITVISVIVSSASLLGQGGGAPELARSLANEQTRAAAVDKIATGGVGNKELLLSWTRTPPAGLDKFDLYVGLADAFGRLRAKEAIPFLINQISLQRGLFYRINIWLKTPEVVEDALPAVAALIRIGPDASRSLIKKFRTMPSGDRIPAIFVISRIKGVPDARDLLVSVIGQANLETFWAKKGIAGLGTPAP